MNVLASAIVAALVRRRGGVVILSARELAELDGAAVACRLAPGGGTVLALMTPKPAGAAVRAAPARLSSGL